MSKNEKNLYENLTSYFKYLVTITVGAITILGVFAGYFFYSNGQEMREDLREQRLEVKDKVDEMKTALKDQKQEFEAQKSVMKEELTKLSQKTNLEIDATRTTAINEISNIKGVASTLAEEEARKKINEVFNNKNFDQFVADIAKERMEPQINNLVDKKILTNESIQVNNAIENLSSKDKVKSIQASNYLQLYSQTKLSDNQISKIINDMKNVDTSTRNNMIGAILLKKSQPSTAFFRTELEKCATNTINESYCLQYFLYNDIDFNIFTQALQNAMSKKSEGYNTYYTAILFSKEYNRAYTLNLLNDKKLVDLYFKLLPKGYEEMLSTGFLDDLKNVFSEKELLKTAFFISLKAGH